MGIVGAEAHMPLGEPWRVGKRPYGRSALSIAASCLKGFYLHQASLGGNVDLGEKLDGTRLPARVDRRRSCSRPSVQVPWELRVPEPGRPFELCHDGRRHLHSVDRIRGRQSTVPIARDVAKFLRTRGFTS
ncbi:hypothetical protein [Streptomyces sp. NPDC058457]|uniref:hypothetical protein n=1 Tax=Streptomyces sp. NPDC058457 TaxID=3346507 RepID=UPI003657B5F1